MRCIGSHCRDTFDIMHRFTDPVEADFPCLSSCVLCRIHEGGVNMNALHQFFISSSSILHYGLLPTISNLIDKRTILVTSILEVKDFVGTDFPTHATTDSTALGSHPPEIYLVDIETASRIGTREFTVPYLK